MFKPLTILSVLGGVGAIAFTAAHFYAYAILLGVGLGAVYFLTGIAKGGRIGNAHGVSSNPQDFVTRIGICHAATGVAAAGIGRQPPFPDSFVVLYWIFLVIGAIGAGALAIKRHSIPIAPAPALAPAKPKPGSNGTKRNKDQHV